MTSGLEAPKDSKYGGLTRVSAEHPLLSAFNFPQEVQQHKQLTQFGSNSRQ
jgi:hypothetical protein